MNSPLISVIIPTYGREAVLRDTIADVLKQNDPNFEILIIDQTPNHELETQTYLTQLETLGKITWYRLDWASLPGARNYGIRRSKGEIILFIDDDVQLPPEFLSAHRRNYLENPEVGAVAGRVFDRMKLADSGGSLTIETLPPEAMNPAIAWYYIDLVHTTKPQEVLSCRGCNMSFRREVFAKHQLHFDERFKGSAVREESDFCLQFRRTNLKIWYDPEAYLIHLGEETGGCHDISTRSLQYQLTFYHNHFFMGIKNLTFLQCCQFFLRFFDCHVLGHPPCYKSGSPLKIISRFFFFFVGLCKAFITAFISIWNDGQIYTRQDLHLIQK